MKTNQHTLTALSRQSILLLFLLAAADLSARPRPPAPPLPEMPLLRLSFDEPFWLNLAQRTGGQAVAVDNSVWVESWSGYALVRQGAQLQPITIPLATSNRWNLSPDEGALRVWFSPAWSSASTALGQGPGHFARLLELTTADAGGRAVFWSLYVSPDGNTLFLSGQGPDGPVDYLRLDIQWRAGDWHLLALTYGSQTFLASPAPWRRRTQTPTQDAPADDTRAVLLHLDGQPAATGEGLPLVPAMLAAGATLAIGTDAAGNNPADGQFEELSTFDYPLTYWQLGSYFDSCQSYAVLGPITPEEDAARREAALAARSALAGGNQMMMLADTPPPPPGSGGGGGGTNSYSLPPLTNCPSYTLIPGGTVYLTNLAWGGSNICLSVAGGDTNLTYDLFATTSLLGTNMVNPDTLWGFLRQVGTCDTYLITGQPFPNAFYILGTPDDTDRDGLTDAFEQLVSKTSPSTNSTRGDGIGDWAAYYQGRNLHVGGSVPDTNGLVNLQVFTPLR